MLGDWQSRRSSLTTLLAFSAILPIAFAATPHDQTHWRRPGVKANSADCLSTASAVQINQMLKVGGEGTSIVLCPMAQIVLDSHGPPITFTAARQSIYTAGLPEDHNRATIHIAHPRGHFSGDLTTAIKGDCDKCRAVKVLNIQVDGGRNELGGVEGGDAMILVGGTEGEHEVRHVDAHAARGYAAIHARAGMKGTCHGVIITDNNVHTSGDAPLDLMLNSELVRLRDGPPTYRGQERPGHWTDGISVACQQSTVSDNTLRDISGIGIAIRGGPGTQVVQNTIVARDRDMLVGISIVAHPIFAKRPAHTGGVIVRENAIHAASAMIRIGISTGAATWATDEIIGDHDIALGSEIVRNRLTSYTGYYGYGIAISDAKAIEVKDNAISASIWGFQTDACYTRPNFALPAPLIRDSHSVIGVMQGEFHTLHFAFLLCVGPGSTSSSTEESRHQINEAYIEQTATKRRKGRPAAIPANEMRGARAAKGPGIDTRRTLMAALQKKKNSLSEGHHKYKAEPLKPWNEQGQEAMLEGEKIGQAMKRRTLNMPRAAGRHQMGRRTS